MTKLSPTSDESLGSGISEESTMDMLYAPAALCCRSNRLVGLGRMVTNCRRQQLMSPRLHMPTNLRPPPPSRVSVGSLATPYSVRTLE